jgi:hypothetical protein
MAIDDILSRYGQGAAPASGGGDAVDGILSRYEAPAAPAPAAPEARPDKGALDAFGRSALQGASFGFFDEAAAALKALAEGRETGRGGPSLTQRYHANVGEERAQLRAAQEQHPIASTVGQLAGGAVAPGFGLGSAAGLGRGIAGAAARGAGAGILSGAGASEADSVGGVVQDAAKGGLMGAAIGGTVGYGLERALRGAPERVDSRTLQAITGGRATTAGKRVYADDDLVLAAAKKFGLEPEGADPRALAAATKAARDQVGPQLDAAYKAIDHESLGVRTSDIRRAVGSVKADLSSPSDAPLRAQLERYSDAIKDRWGDGARDRIPLQALNKEIGKLEKVGFAGADLSPAAGAQLKRDLAGALNNVLDKRLEEVKTFGANIRSSAMASRPGFAGVTEAADAAQALPSLNRDYRGLRLIQDIADQRAGIGEGGLQNAIKKDLDVRMMLTHPLAFAAKKTVLPVAQAAGRGADRALARLYQASQAGQVTAQLVQDALENGVPRGLISRLAPGVVSDQQSDQLQP